MINLIPVEYLNEACFLSLNTDDKKYNIILKDAQMDLEDILGQEFYAEIETQYDQNTFTSDNDTLYEGYIKDFLAWQAYFHYLKFANIEATPTGIREFTDENSSLIADVKMYSLEKNVKQKAIRYRDRMINYIKTQQANDSTKFSLYTDGCKEQMSFAITSISKDKDHNMIKVNKAVNLNE